MQIELDFIGASLHEAITYAIRGPGTHLLSRIPGSEESSMAEVVRSIETDDELRNILIIVRTHQDLVAVEEELADAGNDTVIAAAEFDDLEAAFRKPHWTVLSTLGAAAMLSAEEVPTSLFAVVADGLGDAYLAYEFDHLRALLADVPVLCTHTGLPETCPSDVRYGLGVPWRPGGFLHTADGRSDVPVFVELAAPLPRYSAEQVARDLCHRVKDLPVGTKLLALLGWSGPDPESVATALADAGVHALAAWGGGTDTDVSSLVGMMGDPDCLVHVRKGVPPYVGAPWHTAVIYDPAALMGEPMALVSQLRSPVRKSHARILYVGATREKADKAVGWRAKLADRSS